MNRDDRLSRPPATPPQHHEIAGVSAFYPSEKPAGTWIAANQFGITLALLNWNRPKLTPKLHSRGGVIPSLISADSTAALEWAFRRLSVNGVWPFRLFGFFRAEFQVREWRWNGLDLAVRAHPWQRDHWFSSGLSDLKAARQRWRIFDSAARDSDAGTLAWLRKLHRQHGGEPGPFSVCVHRSDAATLSYTEVVLQGAHLSMRYAAGQPCTSLRAGALFSVALAIST
jgi:hypothetical protein